MTSIQSKIEKVGTALHAQLGDIVYHYWRPVTTSPMCVWAEDSEGVSFRSDTLEREQAIHGTVDYFTKTEYDPNLDKIQTALNQVALTWALNSVQYEDDTYLIHYEWTFTVA